MSDDSTRDSNDVILPLADAIVQRGLVAPAIFLLELSKPLTGCMRELCVGAGDGLLRFAVGDRFAPAIREVLSSSENVEALITRLESYRDSRGASVSPRQV